MIKEYISPKEIEMQVMGHSLRFCNQKSADWTHLYEYEGNGENLSDAGCGIFSLVHIIEWFKGVRVAPEEAADVSVKTGGRCDDGTDRPAMVKGMMECGFADMYGFSGDEQGKINDHDVLFNHVKAGNAAMCNLRVGHIVALVQARELNGKRQFLVIDSCAESSAQLVKNGVTEIIPETEVCYYQKNLAGVVLGYHKSYAMFWVDEAQTADFNLIYIR